MIRFGPSSHECPAARVWTVLVLAVLAGIFAMHALAPDGMPSMGGHRTTGAASALAHQEVSRTAGPVLSRDACACPGGDCAGMSGMMHHADASCAAAGTSTSYAPPALAVGLPAREALATPASAAAAGFTAGRAPPDLAQLQLLRI